MKHLLSIDDLSKAEIEAILDRAESFAEVGRRDIKKVPTLRGRTIVTLFYESSTRTSSSFELAAKRLSADLISVKAAGSSVDKGESLKDTVATLSAYEPAAIVIRHPHAGAAQLVAGWADAAVVNAGDGKHEHPSQALLDVYTLRRRLGTKGQANLDRRRRPAQPRRPLQPNRLQGDGGRTDRCGPPALIPRGLEELGCAVEYSLDRLREADVVYALRLQRERMAESFIPSIREYATRFQIDSRRLGRRQLLMHPGPVNRGVELSGEVIDSPQSLISEQVASGTSRPNGDPLRAACRRVMNTGPRTGDGVGTADPDRAARMSPAKAGMRAGKSADLVLRNVTVLDPIADIDSQHDLVVRDGRIAELAGPGAASDGRPGRDRRGRPPCLPGVLRSPRPPAGTGARTQGGHRDWNARRCRRRL